MTTTVSSLKDFKEGVSWTRLSKGDAFIDDSTKEGVLFFKMSESEKDDWNSASFTLGDTGPETGWWQFKADDMVTPVNVEMIVSKKA
jgi:hypothetical protein